METKLINDVCENARVLKIKGIETIEVERPEVVGPENGDVQDAKRGIGAPVQLQGRVVSQIIS